MRKATPYFFLLPAVFLLTFFVLWPACEIIGDSMLRYSAFGENSWTGFDNYVRLAADPNFWWTLANSFLYVLVTPVIMLSALTLALVVRRAGRIAGFARAAYFIPVVTPIVIAGIVWRWIFTEDTGLLNYLLGLLGIGRPHWLTGYPTNVATVMIVTLWRGAGYYMMIFLAGLAAIPREIEEASLLDGAGAFRQTVDILIPLLRPTIVFVFVISASAAMRIFTEIYVMIPGAPMSNKALVSYLYQQAFERFDLGYGSAIGVVLFILTFGFSYMNIRLLEARS